MPSKNEVTLENLIIAYINSVYPDVPPTEEQLQKDSDLIRRTSSYIASVTDEEFENIKKRLSENITVTMDKGICLNDRNNGHKSWLPSRRADIDFYFWDRYKRYLEIDKHWNSRVTAKLGQVSDDILDQCGDPKGEDFHIKGLILGDVQSGKTSNYTALANKAADAGYELIIVLAGIPELLRQQTQKRLDREFCGISSNQYLDPKSIAKYNPVGVGRYGDEKKIASFTSEASDFNVAVLKNLKLSLDTVKSPILLVVKKNKTILNNLYKWVKNNNALNANGQIEKSLFLIDDEADNASINTHDADSDPTAINKAIRRLFTLFSKSTYLAVTATPFANIFINPSSEDDLFPSDFIYALDAPSNYIGADQIFSDDADYKNMLQRINVYELNEYIPDKHKKDLKVNGLPSDLYEACYYFLLVNAIRDYRGDAKEHRSMMIHVSRFVNVQNQIADILIDWLEQVKSDLRNYGKLSPIQSEKMQSINEMHQIWNKYSLESISGLSWNKVLKEYLYRAVAPIDVRSVNGSTHSDPLDYDNHKDDGLRVIAVGGNTLSRGLTLEGLMVTYFYRNSNMYDTLMQMGRWFGYRPNYDDLVKIWLSQDAIDAYGQIDEATDDLKIQISRMKKAGQSPRDFGLKVRQDPGSLIVTARNKMRSAKPINCPVSVSGHLLETPRLYANRNILEENAKAVEKFIDRLSAEGKRVPSSDSLTGGNYFWKSVSADLVSELLDSFVTHPWHMSYNGKALADYVANNTWSNGWDVVLMNTGKAGAYPKDIKCGNEFLHISHTQERNIVVRSNGDKNVICVSGSKLRVGSGGCARIGLNQEQIKKAQEDFRNNYNGRKKSPSYPDSAYLIKERNPILMIHIIKGKYENPEDEKKYGTYLYGLGVGFPDDDREDKTATYVVNLVELSNWIDLDESEDE